MKRLLIVIAALLILTSCIGAAIVVTRFQQQGAIAIAQQATKQPSREQVIKDRLAYLLELPEVEWYEIDGNDVYIGFNSVSTDLGTIVRAAAFHGNKAIDFGVHAWAVDAKYKGWRSGQGQPYICEATARYGKVQDSNCD